MSAMDIYCKCEEVKAVQQALQAAGYGSGDAQSYPDAKPPVAIVSVCHEQLGTRKGMKKYLQESPGVTKVKCF